MPKCFTSSSDIAAFSSLQVFDSIERNLHQLGNNMDYVCLLLKICLTFESIVIKSSEPAWKSGRELIFSDNILMMVFCFGFRLFKKCICSRGPLGGGRIFLILHGFLNNINLPQRKTFQDVWFYFNRIWLRD